MDTVASEMTMQEVPAELAIKDPLIHMKKRLEQLIALFTARTFNGGGG